MKEPHFFIKTSAICLSVGIHAISPLSIISLRIAISIRSLLSRICVVECTASYKQELSVLLVIFILVGWSSSCNISCIDFSVIQAGLSQINLGQSLCTEGALNNSFDTFRLPGYGHALVITVYQKNYVASTMYDPPSVRLAKDASLYAIIYKSSGLPKFGMWIWDFTFYPFFYSPVNLSYAFYIFLF